jgi:hypothetical protein
LIDRIDRIDFPGLLYDFNDFLLLLLPLDFVSEEVCLLFTRREERSV